MSIPVPEKRIAEFEKKAFGMFIHWGLYSSLDRGEWTFDLHEDQKYLITLLQKTLMR